MIIPEGATIYVKGGKAYRPGADCPDRLISDEVKSKIDKAGVKFKSHQKSKADAMNQAYKKYQQFAIAKAQDKADVIAKLKIKGEKKTSEAVRPAIINEKK